MPRIQVVSEERYSCGHGDCDNDRTASTSVAGSYCSRECRDRADGKGLLEDIRQDHRFCWSCFRQRKSIEKPPAQVKRGRGKHTAEAIVGFEYLTEHSERGSHGIECTCGAVGHDIDWSEARQKAPIHWFLTLASRQLVDDGRRDDSIDVVTLADELWQTDDLELAVGRALHSR